MSVTWLQIRESLQAFDRTAILHSVQQLLDAELPALRFDSAERRQSHRRPSERIQASPEEIWPLVKKLYPILIQTAGSWYGAAGLYVGDGSSFHPGNPRLSQHPPSN